MGASKSRQVPFSYEEACRRIDGAVLARVEETFRRLSAATGYLPQNTFTRDILGDGVPLKLAEELYRGCGGSQKGLSLKDLVCGLALLAHGSVDEKAKFLSLLLSEDGFSVGRGAVDEMVAACEAGGFSPVDLDTLFRSKDQFCSVREFEDWVKLHPNLSSFTKWLLVPGESGFSLVGDPDPPTFYQTLGRQHGVSEKEVMDLERTYWSLKSGITTGGSSRFDLETFTFYSCPPVPEPLCRALFGVFDDNCDGQLDLAEMVRAVGWCCRSRFREKHNLCFKVFDEDGDGVLSREELTSAISQLQNILRDNSEETTDDLEDVGSMVSSALEKYAQTQEGCMSEEEYLKWAESTTPISLALLHVLYQVCHVRFGLRPCTKADETMVIGGYLVRFHKAGLKPGNTVYIIDGEWFKQWKKVAGYEGDTFSHDLASSGKKKKKKKKKDKHRHKKHRPPSPQVVPEAGKAHASTQTPPTLGEGPAERGEDVVELLTVTEGGSAGGRHGSPSSSYSSLTSGDSPSQAGSWGVASGREAAGPVENRIPLIDNSPLLVHDLSSKKITSLTNEGGFLQKKVLVEGENFFFLPEVVWKVFASWYGTAGLQGGPALPRLVRPDSTVDYYPVQFKVYRHTTLPPAGKPSSLPWPIASVFGTLGLISGKPAAPPVVSSGGVGPGGAEGGPIQPPIPRRVLYYYAAFTGNTSVAEMSEYIEKVLHVKSEDLRLYDLTDEENPVHLDDETRTVSDLKFGDGQKLLIETRNKDNSWPEEIIAVMKEVRAKDKEKKDKQEGDKSDSDVQVPHGATGLSNLGNTCFMNSALQCVSNVQPLTQYFKEKDYLLEINRDNPLGMGGVMAKRYGELVQDLWNGHSKSITPLKFRFTVGRCAPRFNGFQQQDAQELLAFVLDGLHEDLNRVKEKPYKELKDSDGRPDDEVSREAWDYHLSRNRSVIVDLFQGQLKSVVRCKVCNYKSVRFDPFTFLSLPLPMESTINVEIIVVRLDSSQQVRYGLKLEVDDKYRALLANLSRLTGIKKSNLLLVEIYGAMIRSFPPDATKIRSQLGGWLYAFEIPDAPVLPPSSRAFNTGFAAAPVIHTSLATTSTHLQTDTPPTTTEEVRGGDGGGEGGRGETGDNGEERGSEVARKPDSLHEWEGREGGSGEGRDAEGGTQEEVVESGSAVGGEGEEEGGWGGEDGADEARIEVTRNSSIDGSDMESGVEDFRPSLDRPLGSRDPTPPILLAPEDDDRLTGRDAGLTPESHDPRVESHDTGMGVNSSTASPLHSGEIHDGFVFAIHRKKFLVEQYFVASQKNRPVLFGTPVVVPCTPATPCRAVYDLVWQIIRRLIIPDKPSPESKEKRGYPFKLALVGKDGLSCAICPWHKFCRGCPIECDDSTIGDSSPYIAIDWDINILHLKYQSAQERPVEHESMETLKTMDLDPIDLYECFKAFVREDDLGDEECWFCKQCNTHQEAVKSLEIWRLPAILIIHLKRFQFFNGRWVKSQRIVRFPTSNLDPLRFTAQNGNEPRAENGTETGSNHSQTDQEGARSSSPDTRPEESTNEDTTTPTLANGGRGHPGMIGDPPASPGSQLKQLDRSLHRREGNIYNLVAITCHTGVLGGGHYTSLCKNPNGKWYYYNDSSCKETGEERILEESPYMLFYEMKDLDHYYSLFRAMKGGKRQDISSTEDDKAYEETLRNLSKKCCIQ